MSNLRILYDNAADRAAVTASSTAGALVAANLQTDTKSDVWRATGPSARLTLAWAVAEAVQAVALPFCNLSPTATMRVRATNEAQATNIALQTGTLNTTPWATGTNYFLNNNVLAAPDGSMTADVYGPKSGLTSFDTAVTCQDVVLGQGTYTVSRFFKAVGGATQVRISDRDNATGNTVEAVVTLSGTPAVTPSYIGGTAFSGTPIGGAIAYPGGWYRVWITFTVATAGGVTLRTRGFPYAGGAAITGDGTLGLACWGLMVNAGSLSSYYPSGASVGTRPLGYIDSWQSYDYDSGTVLACPAPALRPRGWTAAQAASAYTYGGGAYARMWLPAAVQAVGLAIDIVDANNLQGYIEAARLVAGPYWSPTYNASEASMTVVDTTELYRTDAGDQGASAGYQYRRVPVSLSAMPAADRAAFVNIVRNSRAAPILLSVFPESTDLALERDHMVYGRRSKDSDVAIQYAASYSTAVEIEEI